MATIIQSEKSAPIGQSHLELRIKQHSSKRVLLTPSCKIQVLALKLRTKCSDSYFLHWK